MPPVLAVPVQKAINAAQRELAPLDVLDLKLYDDLALVTLKSANFNHHHFLTTLRQSLEVLREDQRIARFVLDLKDLPTINKDVGDTVLACRRADSSRMPVLLVNQGGSIERWLRRHAHAVLCEFGYSLNQILNAAHKNPAAPNLELTDKVASSMALNVVQDRFENASMHRKIADRERANSKKPEFIELDISTYRIGALTITKLNSKALAEDSLANKKFGSVMTRLAESCDAGLILDLSSTKYFGSTSYGVLIKTSSILSGRAKPFVLVLADSQIAQNIHFKKLDQVMKVCASVDQALEAITA